MRPRVDKGEKNHPADWYGSQVYRAVAIDEKYPANIIDTSAVARLTAVVNHPPLAPQSTGASRPAISNCYAI